MRDPEGVQHLVDDVEAFVGVHVLMCLRHEGVEIQVSVGKEPAPASARHFQVEPLGHHHILAAEEPGTVGRQLRLPAPLQEGQLDREQRNSGQHRQGPETDQRQNGGNGAVERVPADDVTELVGQQGQDFILIENFKRGRVEDDERVVDPVGAGIEDRGLRDVELGDLVPAECGAVGHMHLPEPGKLARSHADGVGLKEQADAAFTAEEGQDLSDDLVHTGNGAEGLQGRPVGRMFPRHGRDVGERAAGPRGGKIRHVWAWLRGGAITPGSPRLFQNDTAPLVLKLQAPGRGRRSGPRHPRSRS